MKITDLPFDCLLQIFNNLSKLSDLINCYRAHNHWEEVILSHRLMLSQSFKYLDDDLIGQLLRHANYGESDLSNLLSNVKVLDLKIDTLSYSEIYYLANNLLNVKIIITTSNVSYRRAHQNSGDSLIDHLANMRIDHRRYQNRPSTESPIVKAILVNFKKLEILTLDTFDYQQMGTSNDTHPTIKHLYLNCCDSKTLSTIAKVFPNLQKLHIQNLRSFDGFPPFENLKVLIYSANFPRKRLHVSEQVIAICPNLESGFFAVCPIAFQLFGQLNNTSLKNLVLEFKESFSYPQYLQYLLDSLSKMENLENLSIRYLKLLKDDCVIKLVHNCPKLSLLDLSKCPMVTSASSSLVSNYSQVHQRLITFIYPLDRDDDSEHSESTKNPEICQDFDFMKNCWPRTFYDLPRLENFDVTC